jgi:hypothetical protein
MTARIVLTLLLALLCAICASGCSATAQARFERAAVRVGEAVAVRVVDDLLAD